MGHGGRAPPAYFLIELHLESILLPSLETFAFLGNFCLPQVGGGEKLKTNPRPYYKYLRSKLKLKKAVSDLKDSTGNLSGNPQDTANILSDFFHSVFIQEEY